MNETISRDQAKRIVDEFNKFAVGCRNLLVNKSQEFAQNVSKVWEDYAAVDCFRGYKESMESIIKDLKQNTSIFVERIEDIHNRYARAGNMPIASFSAVDFSTDVDVSAVKSDFGDEFKTFGFLNPKSSAGVVMGALIGASNDMMNGLDSLVSQIRSIPAFGNPEVRNAITGLANTTSQAVHNHFERVSKKMRETIDDMAQQYTAAGTESVVSATEAINTWATPAVVTGTIVPKDASEPTVESPRNTYRPRPVVKPSNITGQTDSSAMIE